LVSSGVWLQKRLYSAGIQGKRETADRYNLPDNLFFGGRRSVVGGQFSPAKQLRKRLFLK
jgi:hypothetical protein